MQNADEALLSIILAGQGLLVKMLITFEPHNIFFDQILHTYTFLKLAGKMTKTKKYWTCLDSKHCALGCWIKRETPRPLGHHILYTAQEQFTYIPNTCAYQSVVLASMRPAQWVP